MMYWVPFLLCLILIDVVGVSEQVSQVGELFCVAVVQSLENLDTFLKVGILTFQELDVAEDGRIAVVVGISCHWFGSPFLRFGVEKVESQQLLRF
jgi:hypothetical protein